MLIKISKHFSISEIACHCGCSQAIVNKELIEMAEKLRNLTGLPMIVSSVNRCTKHNSNVGGVSNSLHLSGSAMDFHIKGIPVSKLHEIALAHHTKDGILKYGLGIYSWGCHIDVGKFRIWEGI